MPGAWVLDIDHAYAGDHAVGTDLGDGLTDDYGQYYVKSGVMRRDPTVLSDLLAPRYLAGSDAWARHKVEVITAPLPAAVAAVGAADIPRVAGIGHFSAGVGKLMAGGFQRASNGQTGVYAGYNQVGGASGGTGIVERTFADGEVVTITYGETFADGSSVDAEATDGAVVGKTAGATYIPTNGLAGAVIAGIATALGDAGLGWTHVRIWHWDPAAPDPAAGLKQFATRTGVAKSVSDGSETSATYRSSHVARAGVTRLRAVFANFGWAGANANPVTVKASIEYPVGTVAATFTFDAQGVANRLTIPTGTPAAASDWAVVPMPPDADFKLRTYVEVASGEVWPIGVAVINGFGEGKAAGVDLTAGGTISDSTAYAYGPLALVAETDATSYAIMGNSIADGSVDGSAPAIDHGRGYLHRAIDPIAPNIHIHNPGAGVADFDPADADNAGKYLAASYCTDAIVEVGVNSRSEGMVSLQGSLQAIWDALDGQGQVVRQTTITPVATSTDGWATVENQTPDVDTPTINALNDWIRTDPSPLVDHLDASDALSTARNSGKWGLLLANDPLHPNGAGHAEAAEYVARELFSITSARPAFPDLVLEPGFFFLNPRN